MSYVIYSDSSCNLTDDMIEKLELSIVSLVYIANGTEIVSYVKGENNDLEPFYKKLRDKMDITTSCVNEETFYDAFKLTCEKGEDILYIGFSSSLSATYQSGENALKRLREEFPERKLISVDTLSGSLGEGLLVCNACTKRQEGETIDEVAQWVEDNKLKVAHWFTVEDLYWLFKGGRITKTTMWVANLTKIKPILNIDNSGHLVPVSKAIGRKRSLIELANHVVKTIVDPENQIVYISHGDCIEDVEFLKKKINDKIKVKGYYENYVDPVLGAHSGPGTMAVFFFADHR